jgi:hypothetical protein
MVTSAAPGQTVHPSFTPGPNAVDGATRNTGLLNADGLDAVDAGGPLLIGQLPTDKADPGLRNSLLPLGNANRVPFSRFEGGSGWAVFRDGSTGGDPFFSNFGGLFLIVADPVFSAANQNHYLFNSPPFQVAAGERLSVAAGIEARSLSGPAPQFWQFYIDFLNSSGVNIGGATIASGSGDTSFASANRLAGFVTVPANAVRAVLNIRLQSAGAGTLRAIFLEPMVTSAAAGQTVHPPFTAGPNAVDGATRNTGALNADGLNAVDAGGPLLIGQLPTSKADPGLVNTNVPLGANTVINSDFTRGKFGWRAGNGATDAQWGVNLAGTPNWFGQRNVMWARADGAFAINSVRDVSPNALWEGGGLPNALLFAMPVVAGDRIAASVLAANHRCSFQLYILVFDGAGTLISAPVVGGGTSGGAQNGDPANFSLLTNFADVPTNGRWAIPMMRMLGTGESDPYIFFTEPMLSKIAAGQTTAPRYSPGRADTLADETVTAQRTIEAQFPVIEIKQGEAGHTGNRTVTHTAKRGITILSGGTWSLTVVNLGTGSASINSSTGTVTLSGIVQSGAYAIRYTHTDGNPTDNAVNVTYVPASAAGVVSAKTGQQTSNAGTDNNNNWQTILSLTINSVPTGRVTFVAGNGTSFLSPSSATDTADFEARLRLDGTTTLTSLGSQNVVSGGVLSFADFTELFAGSYAVSSGNRTFTIELRRTNGSGRILARTRLLKLLLLQHKHKKPR